MACRLNQTIEIETLRTKSIKIRIKNSQKFLEWKIKENGFYNQLTFEFVDGTSKKSIKIFPNGRVHVTGCSDMDDCHKVMHQICFVMTTALKTPVKIESFDIYMINTNFTMNSTLNLYTVINIMKKKGFNVSFNPEVYSAVKVKFSPGIGMKQITASIFSSGCVLITGAVSLKEITEAYKLLVNSLKVTCIKSGEEVITYDIFMGRKFEYWRKLYC